MVEWFVTRYVEYVKFKALAQATKRAHPVILKLSDLYATSARATMATELADASDRFAKAQGKFEDAGSPTDAQVKSYVTAAVKFDAALKAHAARPLESFTVAHEIAEAGAESRERRYPCRRDGGYRTAKQRSRSLQENG